MITGEITLAFLKQGYQIITKQRQHLISENTILNFLSKFLHPSFGEKLKLNTATRKAKVRLTLTLSKIDLT